MIELFDAFAAGLYTVFALLLFDLWPRRPEHRGYLFLALASLGALIVDLTGMAARRFLPDERLLINAANSLAITLVAICLLELVLTFETRPAGRLARGLELGVALLAITSTVAPLEGPLLLGCATLLVLASVRARLAQSGPSHDVRIVARGFLVLVATLLLDVLMLLDLLPMVRGLPILGFAVLFAASAKSLNDRFDREHRELIALRADLEHKVVERTAALHQANLQLEQAARTDPLTGLPNRRAFWDRVEVERLHHQRSAAPLSLVLLDVDHFKQLNDRFGHSVGDLALRHLAAIIRERLRAQDLVARWGGEEFVVVLPETGIEGALAVSENLRVALATTPLEIEGGVVMLSASFGVAELPADGLVESTLNRADAALYRAKATGRNRVVAAGQDPATETTAAAATREGR
jgi:diguanylate cyclase (GGDEF)-like protein